MPAISDGEQPVENVQASALSRLFGEGIGARGQVFVFFRVAALAALAMNAAVANWFVEEDDPGQAWRLWSVAAFAYGLSMLASWMIARRNSIKWRWLPILVDVVFAAGVVQLTGGADSPFTFLYLISILGAVSAGDYRLCWVTFGASALIYITMCGAQASGLLGSTSYDGAPYELTKLALSLVASRTLLAMLAVAALAANLAKQWTQSESRIEEIQALYADILRALGSGLLTTDTAGTVIYANPTAAAILGKQSPLVADSLHRILPGLDPQSFDQERRELSLTREADGHEVKLGWHATPLRDQQDRALGHVIHFQDITQLRQLEAELARAERLAVIGQLAATIAHEVRNPLAGILGCAELLEQSMSSARDRRLLAVITRESTRLERTVSQLLEFTSDATPQPSDVDLVTLTSQTLEAFENDPSTSQLQLEFTHLEHVPAWVDKNQYVQVVWNLLRNAAQAQEFAGKIGIELELEANAAVLRVNDEGPGIDPSCEARVFDPFFSTKRDGTGFGLAVIGRIAKANYCEIKVSRREPTGTCFELRWPRHATVQDIAS